MKRNLVTIVLFSLLIACARTPTPLNTTYSATALSGPGVAAQLTTNYFNKATNCGSNSAPAFLCSGVILRTTTTSNAFDPWDHSDFSRSTKAVSFAFLRTDTKFGLTPWGIANGYILYPILQAPAGKLDPDVICYFPLDGATFYRNAPDQYGCRDSIVTFPYPNVSRPCREQGITTAEQWVAHYKSPAGSQRPNAYSCSLMVTDDLNSEATTAFNQGIRVRALIPAIAFKEHNELRIKTWPEHNPAPLPIMAFFYISDGVANAKVDQRKYFDRTGGQVIPVIRLTLPANAQADAKFEYFTGDQAVFPNASQSQRPASQASAATLAQ